MEEVDIESWLKCVLNTESPLTKLYAGKGVVDVLSTGAGKVVGMMAYLESTILCIST